ncbi:MAG: DUF2752 domain-containing protein [Phycisphaerae bacterium]|nr:DUF2752 domain-containing protein [Phycisphaerae bacterium]
MLIFLVVALPLIGTAVLEAVHYDIGRLFAPCGFKVSHGLPCPTCGYTTSLRAFSRGHWVAAFKIQPGACFFYVSLVASAVMGIYVALSGHYPHWLRKGLAECTPKYIFLGTLLVVLLGWAVLLAQAFYKKS